MNETATPPLLEARGLNKVFRDFWHRPKVRAVDGIDFAIQPGEVFGLLGPNGSGKSTTIKMILGLLHPTAGTLSVFGSSPRDVRTKQRIGYLPEESYLYNYLTAEETLRFYSSLFEMTASERNRRIEDLLELIGLSHARKRTVGEFSKGMARRIGLAQALVNDPDLVILDEPTSGLDPIGCRQVKDLIIALSRRGKTVLLSSHLLADVEDVCDRVAILYNGKVQAQGPMHDLLEEKNRYRFTLEQLTETQLESIVGELSRISGSEPTIDHPRRDLERFFLDVVERARREVQRHSGVGESAGDLGFLSDSSPTSPTDESPESPDA